MVTVYRQANRCPYSLPVPLRSSGEVSNISDLLIMRFGLSASDRLPCFSHHNLDVHKDSWHASALLKGISAAHKWRTVRQERCSRTLSPSVVTAKAQHSFQDEVYFRQADFVMTEPSG